MAIPLPPAPNAAAPGDFVWVDWYNKLQKILSVTGSIAWNLIDFKGSKLTDIINRDHNDLNAIQGGTATEHYHLSLAQYTNIDQLTSAPVTVTANFTVATTDVWIINNKSGSTCIATLPTASTNTGRVLHFQNYQAKTLVSASSNVIAIAGGAASTAILAAVVGDTCTLISNGTNWITTQYTPNNILLLE
jgi:hypothetical protein